MSPPHLVILGGLPGTGKTTVSRLLAARIGAVHLRIDTIETALTGSAWGPKDLGPLGYEVAYALARDNLALGLSVLADSVNPLPLTRQAWRSVAEDVGVSPLQVEFVCSDPAIHRTRVESRAAAHPEVGLPQWTDILTRDYVAWLDADLRIDTAFLSLNQSVDRIYLMLDGKSDPPSDPPSE
ncbi:MAG: AAA family ATPase [Rhodospirillum sp.]|nr:AAA family ATPase [Rhodospirillum sp.]MCF8489146.1 AAA family ATPase [Rhodospirillum sp.]MCF8499813.1 AAA family ATPase [Rhodospirillum sp.]